jgi:hypothetical protein
VVGVSRREWVALRVAHPTVDPTDLHKVPDDLAMALIAANGEDPAVWEQGGEDEALRAYARALTSVVPDLSGWTEVLKRDASIALMVRTAFEAGVSLDTFLSWPQDSQDAAMALVALRGDTCPAGHPAEGMADPEAVQIKRVYCATCARVHDLEKRVRDMDEDARVGWHVEVTRRVAR